MAAGTTFKWYGETVLAKVDAQTEAIVKSLCIRMTGYIKEQFGRTLVKRNYRGKEVWVSAPGTPPAVQTGRLRASIGYDIQKGSTGRLVAKWAKATGSDVIVGRVGTIRSVAIGLDNKYYASVAKKKGKSTKLGGIATSEEDISNTGGSKNKSKIKNVATKTTKVNAKYPIYLELGTSKMKARPFIRPAFTKFLPVIKRELEAIKL